MANPAKTPDPVQARFQQIMRACLTTPPEKPRKKAKRKATPKK